MTQDTWNPTQYAKFKQERERPFFDLLALVQPEPAMKVVDLGCGTGSLTRVLHERVRAHETFGLDRSARMLDVAQAGTSMPGLRFEIGDIEQFAVEHEYDLVFSNAALQWVGDHEALLNRLARSLKPNGQLAFQVPAMHDSPSHTLAEALTRTPAFREAFVNWQAPLVALAPEQYARLMYKAGFRDHHVRLVVYPHVLPSRNDVVEWMKGTLLTAYEKALSADRFAEFAGRYEEQLLAQLDSGEPYLFPLQTHPVLGAQAGLE